MVSIRDKVAQGLGNTEMMHEFNRLFAELVDECHKLNQCVDHHGLYDRFLLLLVHHTDAHIYVFSVELSVHGHIQVSFNNNLNTCRKVSVEMSKQFRIVPVDSKTRTTPISRHFEKILCAIRNRKTDETTFLPVQSM